MSGSRRLMLLVAVLGGMPGLAPRPRTTDRPRRAPRRRTPPRPSRPPATGRRPITRSAGSAGRRPRPCCPPARSAAGRPRSYSRAETTQRRRPQRVPAPRRPLARRVRVVRDRGRHPVPVRIDRPCPRRRHAGNGHRPAVLQRPARRPDVERCPCPASCPGGRRSRPSRRGSAGRTWPSARPSVATVAAGSTGSSATGSCRSTTRSGCSRTCTRPSPRSPRGRGSAWPTGSRRPTGSTACSSGWAASTGSTGGSWRAGWRRASAGPSGRRPWPGRRHSTSPRRPRWSCPAGCWRSRPTPGAFRRATGPSCPRRPCGSAIR